MSHRIDQAISLLPALLLLLAVICADTFLNTPDAPKPGDQPPTIEEAARREIAAYAAACAARGQSYPSTDCPLYLYPDGPVLDDASVQSP